jgi:Tfp pilus assembly protein PilZ
MKRKPLLLIFAALLFLFFPAEWFAQNYRFHLNFQQSVRTDLVGFILSVVLPLLLMAGLMKVSRFGWYALICFAVISGVRDAHAIARFQGGSPWTAVGHVFVFAISLFYFVHPRIRTLYFDPKKQWWKTKPRYATHLPALCFDGADWHYPILANISSGGCFFETPHVLETDKEVLVTIPLPEPLGVSVLRAKGQVKWVSKDEQRTGYGIQFTEIDRRNQRALNRLVVANA